MAQQAPRAWEIDEGITDPERFFALLPTVFPQATLFFVEGSPAKDVVRCYKQYANPGPFLPGKDAFLGLSWGFRCSASPAFFQALSELGNRYHDDDHRGIGDHLSLYEGDRQLFHWHDSFANVFMLDGRLPESTVAALAKPFGCRYARVGFVGESGSSLTSA